MSEGSSDRRPTPKRLEAARREGTFPYSRLCAASLVWLAAGWMFAALGPAAVDWAERTFRRLLVGPAWQMHDPRAVWRNARDDLNSVLLVVATGLLAGCAILLVSGGMQTRWYIYPQRLWYRPAGRFRPHRAVAQLLIQLSLALALAAVAVWQIVCRFPEWLALRGRWPAEQAVTAAHQAGFALTAVGLLMLAWGAVELAVRRWRIQLALRPSDHERREELRAIEGDAGVQHRLRERARAVNRPPPSNLPRHSRTAGDNLPSAYQSGEDPLH
jgi:flagellar biosynthesis protein FlhB